MKVEILRNKVIPLEDLERQIILIVSRFKDDLSNMSGSLSNQVASITEPAIAYELIEKAKNDALERMSEGLSALCDVETMEEVPNDYDEDDLLFDDAPEEKEEKATKQKKTSKKNTRTSK